MKHLMTRKQAEEATGKSRATLARYVKQGKLSVAQKNDQGHNLFDPAELMRVFGDFKLPDADKAVSEKSDSAAVKQGETAVMQAELDALRKRVADLEEDKEDLKGQRDKWQQQAEASQLLLTHNKPKKKGWFGFGS